MEYGIGNDLMESIERILDFLQPGWAEVVNLLNQFHGLAHSICYLLIYASFDRNRVERQIFPGSLFVGSLVTINLDS
jgi:hypothetical protein